MSRKILFVNPNLMKPVVAPLAIDYLAQSAEEKGFQPEILDLSFAADPNREIERSLAREEYLLVAVTVRNLDDSYFASQDFCLRQTKGIIDAIRNRTGAPVVLGGVGFSVLPAEALEYCGVEWGIKGEGEWSLPLLAGQLAAGKDPQRIPGLVRAGKNGRSGSPARYGPLADISLAGRRTLDNRRYFEEGGMVGFETKRGCDRKCVYCADPLSKGRAVRCRNPRDVADEISSLYAQGIDHFHTCDSEFNVPEEHAIQVCREIAARGLGEKIRWFAYGSPESFSEELASCMKKAGCAGIDFGVDHGADSMLRRLGRSFTRAGIENTARLARKYGFSFMFDLLFGAPGETRETIRETVDLMKTLSPDRIGISLGVRLYAGTPLARRIAEKEGLERGNKNLHGVVAGNKRMLQPVFYLGADLGEDIEAFIEKEIQGDPRFLLGSRKQIDRNYNYNANSRLMEAIQKGYRGAFWDILRRLG